MVPLEVWNELNLEGFFAWDDAHAEYAALVRATYAPLKRAAPSVRVLAGALSQTDRPFLEGLYKAGMKGHYDAVSVHPSRATSLQPICGAKAGASSTGSGPSARPRP